MRWNYGSLYKNIRKNKGYTQQQITSHTISRTTLSKLENNKIHIGIANFEFLLEQIDMSFDEFLYLLDHRTQKKRETLIEAFFSLVSNVDSSKILALKTRCLAYLKQQDDISIKEIITILDALVALAKEDTTSLQQSKVLVGKIWQRLNKMDTWYYYEIRLLNCILYFLPIETVQELIPRLLTTLKRYEDYHRFDYLKLVVFVNISTLLLHHQKKVDCEKITKKVYHLAKLKKRYDFLAIAQVRLGICRGDLQLIEEGRRLLLLTKEQILWDRLEEEVAVFGGG
ncbi:helix-turn-helix domain-containing protein [Enterococcus faecalis]